MTKVKTESTLLTFSKDASTIFKKAASLKKIAQTLARQKRTPCYLYDEKEAIKSYRRFKGAFDVAGLETKIFYALKSNPYPGLLSTLRKLGSGFDISGVHELEIANSASAKEVIFTGPGKTVDDLIAVLTRAPKKITIDLDSFHELKNLKIATKKLGKKVKCGIRVVPDSYAKWNKFGIPLTDLRKFYEETRKSDQVVLSGVQFHISYVKNSKVFHEALREVGNYLKANFSSEELKAFLFVDIGGGICPESFEGEYPWNPEGVLLFEKTGLVEHVLSLPPHQRAKASQVEPIESIAKHIAASVKKFIYPIMPHATVYLEPGRYLSTHCMHILMQVADQKDSESVIMNAGWNMVGWEKFQYLYYAPIFNLTNWSTKKELPCLVYGNLCIPEDIWGYYVHGSRIDIGDLLVIPFQGAYTYTYRQEFIRGVPKVVDI